MRRGGGDVVVGPGRVRIGTARTTTASRPPTIQLAQTPDMIVSAGAVPGTTGRGSRDPPVAPGRGRQSVRLRPSRLPRCQDSAIASGDSLTFTFGNRGGIDSGRAGAWNTGVAGGGVGFGRWRRLVEKKRDESLGAGD